MQQFGEKTLTLHKTFFCMMTDKINNISRYFNLFPDMEEKRTIVNQITSGAVFRGANVWVLVFAILIASLGLNVNSTAVIIGAMLISPLMGPIIAMGLAVGTNDFDLFRQSFKNFAVATIVSVVTATGFFLISPFGEAQSELIARTSPTLYDVLIAFCGGAAGIVALSTRDKGNVIPGVAIATALMPPLCTAGYGLASGHFLYFLGAIYLYFINTVFICFATIVGVRLMKFRRKAFLNEKVAQKAKRYLLSVVILTIIPAAYMTYHIVSGSIFNRQLAQFVKEEMSQSGTQIIRYEADRKAKTVRIVAVGKEIMPNAIQQAQRQLSHYGMNGYSVEVIQGTSTDSILQLASNEHNNIKVHDNYTRTIQQQALVIKELEKELDIYRKQKRMSRELSREVEFVCPAVSQLTVSETTIKVKKDTITTDKTIPLIVARAKTRQLTAAENATLQKWLRVKTGSDSVQMAWQ